MGQVLRADKIGQLSEAGGTITLAPSILTIGGQQYVTNSNLQTVPSGLTASTLYRVYAVVSGGSVQLVWDSNGNSSGPVGYSSWKLIGHFYSSRLSNIISLSKATEDGKANLPTLSSKIYLAGDQTVGTTSEKINFTLAHYDFDGLEAGNNRIHILRSGKYSAVCNIRSTALSGGERLDLDIRVNGSIVARHLNGGPVSNNDVEMSTDIELNAGDFVEAFVGSNADASWTVQSGLITSFLAIHEIRPSGLVEDEDL